MFTILLSECFQLNCPQKSARPQSWLLSLVCSRIRILLDSRCVRCCSMPNLNTPTFWAVPRSLFAILNCSANTISSSLCTICPNVQSCQNESHQSYGDLIRFDLISIYFSMSCWCREISSKLNISISLCSALFLTNCSVTFLIFSKDSEVIIYKILNSNFFVTSDHFSFLFFPPKLKNDERREYRKRNV